MLTKFDKFLVAAAGAITQLIAMGVLEDDALKYAQIILAVLTAAGVYLTPNKTAA